MGNGLEGQKTFTFPQSKRPIEQASRPSTTPLPGERYTGLNKSTLDFIVKLTQAGFWGNVEIKFEDGKVTHILQTRSIKP